MTYILHHEARTQFNATTALTSSLRVVTAIIGRTAAGLARGATALPGTISRAFAMAYIDPYQSSQRANDPSNPENF